MRGNGNVMNIFELSGKELVLISALISEKIASEYTPEEQEIIASLLRSISENITVYVAREAINKLNKES